MQTPNLGWDSGPTTPSGPHAPASIPGQASRPRFPDEGSWSSPGYRSADTRARVAQVAHAFTGAASLVLVAIVAQVYPMLDRADRFQLTDAEVDAWLDQVQTVNAVSGLGALVAFVSLLVWLSRSVDNTPPLGGGVARRGPRWAIGAWFIPFVNIVMPALILRDLARRVSPGASGRGRLVLLWWLCYWGPTILGFYIGLLPIHGTDSIREMYAWILATQTISAVGYFVTLFVVRRLQQDAEHWATRLLAARWPPSQSGPVPGWPAAAT